MIEGKIVEYAANGHKYQIDRDLSPLEAKMALAKLEVMYKCERESEPLHEELFKLERQGDNDQVWLKRSDILLKMTDLTEQSRRAQTDLNTMMRETLRNCFNLTVADLDKIDSNEQINIFLQLIETCK